jgi:hypothetical protein
MLPILCVSRFLFPSSTVLHASLTTHHPFSSASCLGCSCSSRPHCKCGGSQKMMQSGPWSSTEELQPVGGGCLLLLPSSAIAPVLLLCQGLPSVGSLCSWTASAILSWQAHPPPPVGRHPLLVSSAPTVDVRWGGRGWAVTFVKYFITKYDCIFAFGGLAELPKLQFFSPRTGVGAVLLMTELGGGDCSVYSRTW